MTDHNTNTDYNDLLGNLADEKKSSPTPEEEGTHIAPAGISDMANAADSDSVEAVNGEHSDNARSQTKDDILTAEDYEYLEQKRNKRSFWDNWLVLGIKAFLLMSAGEMLSGIPIGIIYAVLMLNGSDFVNADAMSDLTSMNYFTSDILNTCVFYGQFLTIWIVALLWFVIRKKNRPLFKALTPFTKGNNLKKFGIGLLIGAGMNGLCILFAWIHKDIELSFSCFELLPLLFIMLFVLIQSSAEELICRCYYYQRLMKSYKNPKLAILLNALFFAALHLGNNNVGILPILDIIVSGILFSQMVYYMDSFWAASACHMAWNYTQNIIFGLPNSGSTAMYSIFTLNGDTGKNSLFYNEGFGIEGSVMSVLVQTVVIVLIWLYYRNKKVKATDIWSR